MAPTPRGHYLKDEAGFGAEDSAARVRGRRYFQIDHCKATFQGLQGNEDRTGRTPSPFCKDSINRKPGDGCGLSSLELSQVYDDHHRRGRLHICHGTSHCNNALSVSTASAVSDPISEESAMFHLGHRDNVQKHFDHDQQAESQAAEGSMVDSENGAGLSSHFLNRKGRLGLGKKKYGKECKWVGYHHHAARVDAFGGEERKNITKRTGWRNDCRDHIFDGQIEEKPERHAKKMFQEHIEKEFHATEDVPIGVSTQIDLDTQGFLGKSKGRSSICAQQRYFEHDPTSDKSGEPWDQQNDVACYGLNQRGKRKFLVQNNLDTGCRHNLSRPALKTGPTLRCSSMPVLERDRPPNQTPYYQDDMPESARAVKKEIGPGLHTDKECDRTLKPRRCSIPADSTWDALAWTPRMVDNVTAARFVEGENVMHATNDDEHQEREFRMFAGTTKRSFGNAHNMSKFRFDYDDDAELKQEHTCVTWTKDEVTKEDKHNLLRWGAGHGRRKFEIDDHFYGKERDNLVYCSTKGEKLGVRAKPVPAHMDPNKKNTEKNFILDADGLPISFKSRSHKPMKDSVHEHMNDEYQSDHSDTPCVVGMRRKTELMRPQSARRFPQKDYERVTPRSLTPRGRREDARIPLAERPIWQK